MPLRAAARQVDITPQLGVALGGMGPTGAHAMGAWGRLKATLLVLDDGAGRVLLIGADLHAGFRPLVAELGRRLAPDGLPPERIVLGATHTHRGPGRVYGNELYDTLLHGVDLSEDEQGWFDPTALAQLADAMEAGARAALTTLTPARLGFARVKAEGISWSRSSEAWGGAQQPAGDPRDPAVMQAFLEANGPGYDAPLAALRGDLDEVDGPAAVAAGPRIARRAGAAIPVEALPDVVGLGDSAADLEVRRDAGTPRGENLLADLRWLLSSDNDIQALIRMLCVRDRVGVAPVPELDADRMLPRSDRLVDARVHALVLTTDAAPHRLVGALLATGATPTMIGDAHALICGDVPGFAADRLRMTLDPDAAVGFWGGTLGDGNFVPPDLPLTDRGDISRLRGDLKDLRQSMAWTVAAADRLAEAARQAIRVAAASATADVSLDVVHRVEHPANMPVEVETDAGPKSARLPAEPRFGSSILAASELTDAPTRLLFKENRVTRGDPDGGSWPMAALPPMPELPTTVPLTVVSLRRAGQPPILLATIPAEVSTRLGVLIRERLRGDDGAHVVVLSLVGDFLGYIGTPREYMVQTYEGAQTAWGPFFGLWVRSRLAGMAQGTLRSTRPAPPPAVAPMARRAHLLARAPRYKDRARLEGQRGARHIGALTAKVAWSKLRTRLRDGARSQVEELETGVLASFDGRVPLPDDPPLHAGSPRVRLLHRDGRPLRDRHGREVTEQSTPMLIVWAPGDGPSRDPLTRARWVVWVDRDPARGIDWPALRDLRVVVSGELTGGEVITVEPAGG